MQCYENIQDLRDHLSQIKAQNQTLGFVPTMGALHAGHLSLVRKAQTEVDQVIVSIFVNPAQFNNRSDLELYPRDLDSDLKLLEETGVDCVFTPTSELMYLQGHESWVSLENLPVPFEGAGRPGHFRGVSTVVSMLFNIVQPDLAVFGEKDFQQLRIIERMVEDLKFPVRIVRGELIRDEDGLALSSRNQRLSAEARQSALAISRGLFSARNLFTRGSRQASELLGVYLSEIESEPDLTLHYAALVDEQDLAEIQVVKENRPARILTAVEVAGVRLLDNIAMQAA